MYAAFEYYATANPVVDLMHEQRSLEDMGGTMRLGSYPCTLEEGSLAQTVYGETNIAERGGTLCLPIKRAIKDAVGLRLR